MIPNRKVKIFHTRHMEGATKRRAAIIDIWTHPFGPETNYI